MSSDFAILTCYFNPCGYSNRERCFQRFSEGLERQGGSLWVIEATLPGQAPFVKESDRVCRVEFSESDWLWQKERLLNLLVRKLPASISKVAWVDCDLLFHHHNWVQMASDALDTWPVIQLFDFMYWLGPEDEVLLWQGISERRASLASIATHYPERATNFKLGTPGFAWAARRELIQQHGLYENDVTGGGDAIIASGLYGWHHQRHVRLGNHAMRHDARNYICGLHEEVRGYVGYLPCRISHLWHGAWANRSYTARRRGLGDHGFDPFRDLEYDESTKLLRWTRYATPELREFVHGYFHSRHEDHTDIEEGVRMQEQSAGQGATGS